MESFHDDLNDLSSEFTALIYRMEPAFMYIIFPFMSHNARYSIHFYCRSNVFKKQGVRSKMFWRQAGKSQIFLQ